MDTSNPKSSKGAEPESPQSRAKNEWIPYVVLLLATSLIIFFIGKRGEDTEGNALDEGGGVSGETLPTPGTQAPASPTPTDIASVAPTGGTIDKDQLQRGRDLSKAVCASCHMYPEPGIETKFSWAFEVLPRMAMWLGYEKLNLTKEKGGDRILAARIIPDAPAMPYEDWVAICNFYIHYAPSKPLAQPERPEIVVGMKGWNAVLPKFDRPPKTTLVKIVENFGMIYLGNDDKDTLDLFKISGQTLATVNLPGPPVGLRESKDGLYVTVIGDFEPSDELNGSVMLLGKPSPGKAPSAYTLLDKLARPSDALFVDLNEDGREDIIVSQFGYILGQFGWFENMGPDGYRPHVLMEYPGAIRSLTYDFNKDGKLDIALLVGQGREGVYLFTNLGGGEFDMEPLLLKHPSWGHSDMALGDFNGDGEIDLLVTNGDNGDRGQYRHEMKPYHGARIYLNDGKNKFTEAYFFPLNGAYRTIPRDYDGDGDLDIAVTGYFPDYVKSPGESFVYLENQGDMKFSPFTFPEAVTGKWLVMDAGDLDGDGDLDIVLGAYNLGPGVVPPAIQEEWDKMNASFLILENPLR
ncbi:MAG: FG-GAP-like repeat-containing protein [Verrucomicrobiia bacterium]|jgi:hypothetical protein